MFVQILQHTSHNQLEALSERRPPWPRQIITPIWPLKNIEAWWWKTNPSPQKNKKNKKKNKKNVLDHYLHHNLVMLLPLWCFFCSFILLIHALQKVPTSLKFYRALHILVVHMHRKFDVDSVDSFWDMEEQSTQSTRRKERKKELESYICKHM